MTETTAKTRAELTDLAPDLRARVAALIDACPYPLGITSAWRSRDEQQRLHDGWKARRPGFNPANPPGMSRHEDTGRNEEPASNACDLNYHGSLACQTWVHDNAHQFGLHFPIKPNPQAKTAARRRGEPWHTESNGQPYNPPQEDDAMTPDDRKFVADVIAKATAAAHKDVLTVLRAKDQPSLKSLDERLGRIEQALGSAS